MSIRELCLAMLRYFLFTVLTVLLLSSSACFPIQDTTSSSSNKAGKDLVESIRLSDSLLFLQPQQALHFAERAVLLAQSDQNLHSLAKALYQRGSARWMLGDLNVSLTDLKQSIELANEIGDKVLIARNNHRIGALYSAVDDKGTAISFYEKALSVYKEQGMELMVIAILNNIGKAYLETRSMDSARFYLEAALGRFKNENNLIKSIVLFNLGDVQFGNNELNSALLTLRKCNKLATLNGDTRAIIRANQLMAEIALSKGDLGNADLLSKKSIQLSEAFGAKEYKFYANRTRANVLFAKGDFEKAFVAQQNSLLYQDSLRNESIINRLNFFNAQKAEEELQELKEKDALLEVRSKYQQQAIVMTSLLLFFAIVAAYLFYRNWQRKTQANKLLVSQKLKIEKQSYELESLSTFKTKVIAIMSHDLKSPLQGLIGIVDILRKKLAEPKELEQVLPSLENSININNHKINDLLEWSGGSIQGENLKTEIVDMSEVVKKAMEDMQTETDKKSVKVEYTENVTPILSKGNLKIFRSVIRNLISNATKFSEPNKVITIEATDQQDYISLKVKDQGIGMTEKQMNELFTFCKGNSQGTSGEKGSGIGLVICKDLIEMVNGSISVSSEVGVGSEFTLKLLHGNPNGQNRTESQSYHQDLMAMA